MTFTTVATLPGNLLVDAFRSVVPHASSDKLLPLLNSVQVSREGNVLTVMATDYYTIGRFIIVLDDDTPGLWSYTFSVDSVKQVISAYRRAKTLVFLNGDDGSMAVQDSGAMSVPLVLRGGDYPDLSRLMDKTYAHDDSGSVALKPKDMEKFALRHLTMDTDSSSKTWPLRFSIAADNRPVRVLFGDLFDALVMPVCMTGGA